MTKEETVRNLLTELIDMIDNGSQRDLDRADEISKSILKVIGQEHCEDCISRQAVLDLVVVNHTELNGVNVVMYSPLCKDIKQLPPVIPQSRWIPVSERLPNRDEYNKNDGQFIVSDGNRNYCEWYDIYDKQRFGEPTMSGFRVDYAVTAWMPLPLEPYKVESEV